MHFVSRSRTIFALMDRASEAPRVIALLSDAGMMLSLTDGLNAHPQFGSQPWASRYAVLHPQQSEKPRLSLWIQARSGPRRLAYLRATTPIHHRPARGDHRTGASAPPRSR